MHGRSLSRAGPLLFMVLAMAQVCPSAAPVQPAPAAPAASRAGAGVIARELTFERRVAIQRTIDRFYWSNQTGTRPPFDRVVPRHASEERVRDVLKKSQALEQIWRRPITAAMLRAEMERVARDTLMPDRLRQLYEALGRDSFVFQESVIRSILADRLAREEFAADERIHAGARARAEALQGMMRSGEIGLDTGAGLSATIGSRFGSPRRMVVRLVRDDPAGSGARVRGIPSEMLATAGSGTVDDPRSISLDGSAFEAWRARAPQALGAIGAVVESPEGFSWKVVLADDGDEATIATYSVPRTTWDEWWTQTAAGFDEKRVPAEAVHGSDLYTLLDADTVCPPDNTWTPTTMVGTMSPRYQHTAVWTGSHMIIWGGSNDTTLYRTGRLYDPVTDTWTPTTTVGAPTGRDRHGAIWTGAEMVVWGGYDAGVSNGGLPRIGGRYNPLTDSWRATTNTGAPSGRAEFVSVWTGSRMLVWGGGFGLSNATNHGRYDPVADVWTPISATNAPRGRQYPSGVWTGTYLVVWGGIFNTGVLDTTGGRNNPVTDTWLPMSATNHPLGIARITAVWSGSEMLHWGGQLDAGAGTTNTGARYDPVADTWTQMTTVSAPPKSAHHKAVWTGKEMIVFGGGAVPGGRYDPATDSWTPVSGANMPANRTWFSAIWDGSRMIVWGGA